MPKRTGVPEATAVCDAELLALLRLRALPGIGDVRGHALLERYGSPRGALQAVLAGERAGTACAPGTPRRAVRSFEDDARSAQATDGWIERALETIERLGIDVIPCYDERYPARLKQLHDPPLVLFARGDLTLFDVSSLAVVGTRAATEHGLDAAHTLAAGVARLGMPIVSGLARGIDTAAHRAALAVEGHTIAVLGAGIDVPYPHENAALHEQIAEQGLLVSEFLPGTPPAPGNFVRRNRIIAALAVAVLVVEAPEKSGAQSTVNHALDLGREVLAVPGPIGRTSCAGTNRLLREGAALVLETADVVDALGGHIVKGRRGAAATIVNEREARPGLAGKRPPPTDAAEAALWHVLGEEDGLHVDVAAARAGLNARDAAAALVQLEMDGRVARTKGMTFKRVTT